jgi:hypothetical protein
LQKANLSIIFSEPPNRVAWKFRDGVFEKMGALFGLIF